MAESWVGRGAARYEEQQRQVAQQQRAAAVRMAAQEQVPNQDEPLYMSVLGTVAGFLDKVWTDDFSAAPVVGPAASAFGDLYTQAAEGISMGLSGAALSANPKYWQNRDAGSDLWADARRVQPGRAIMSLDSAFNVTPESTPGPQGVYQQNDQFNIANDQQRDAMFSNDMSLQIASGVVDGLATWFLDPLVIGGKGVKIARFGTTAMGLGGESKIASSLAPVTSGLTRRTVRDQRGINLNVIKAMEAEADAAMAGYDTPMAVIGERIASQSFDELIELPQFQGASRDLLASAGAAISSKEDGVIFAAAAAGSRKYQTLLRDRATALYAGLQRSTRNRYEEAILNTPIGTETKAILPDFLERDFSVEMLLKDLSKRDPQLRAVLEADALQSKALSGAADLVDSAGTTTLIENIGGVSAKGMRIADAWRQGRQARIYGLDRAKSPRTPVPSMARDQYKAPGIVEQVFYGSSSVIPRVRMWDWVRGYQAAGYIDISGFNVGKASDELKAALGDSRTVRRDKQFVADQLRIYGAAATATERMAAVRRIERNVMDRLAAEAERRTGKKISAETLDEVYRIIDSRRAQVVGNFKDRAYGVDPDTGDVIKGSAYLRSQLETNMPMMNLRMLEKSMKIAAKADLADLGAVGKKTSQSWKNAADEIQSLWKAGVLLRLGYTIRNTGEGWLRTAAFLGSVPALKALPGGGKNFVSNMDRRLGGVRGRKQVVRAEEDAAKRITLLREQLAEARKVREDSLAADPMAGVSPVDESIARLESQIDEATRLLDRLAEKRKYYMERKGYGDKGAFGGELNSEFGDLYRKLSSAEQTTENFLESAWARGQNMILSEASWGLIRPGKPQYWSELSDAVRQFRADEVGRRILAGDDTGRIVAWLRSAEGRTYRREMRVSKEAAENRVVEMQDMIKMYLPTDEAIALARTGTPDAAQLQSTLGWLDAAPKAPKAPKRKKYADDEAYQKAVARYEKRLEAWKASGANGPQLSPIHGKKIAQTIGGEEGVYIKARKATIDRLFYMLGTLPESSLVRHPFYAEVWQRSFDQGLMLARMQGREVTPDLLEQINKGAHRYAMRSTNETLYTIERYSNPASAMRWFAPFFAAWENSFRVWTRLIVNDPSILARASILWQMPGQLGMVVDQEGNKVDVGPLDFLTGSQDKYVVLPAAINDWVGKVAGGANVKVPLGSLNVVTPGETPYLPGFGPIVTYAAGSILAGKPDLQKFLRDNLGKNLYEQIAPFGVPQNNLVSAFAPTAARKMFERWQGEDNEAYLRVVGAMWQTAMVDWYKSGGNPADKPTADDVMQRANDFYIFSSVASLTLPFATTRTSPYQLQTDRWNQLKADPTMTYEEKVEKFLGEFGDDFGPLIVSTSKTDVPGVDPTIEDYNMLASNSGLARELATLAPEAVGIIASSAPVGEFDQGVYKWLNENATPGIDGVLRGPRSVGEMGTAVTMQSAWRDYRKSKAMLDAELQRRGLSSLQQSAAADLKAVWDNYVNVEMVQQYGEEWINNYRTYENNTASYLVGIDMALNNEKFMSQVGNSPLWGNVRDYMESRQIVIDAVKAGADGAAAREAFAEYVNELRYSSLEFSDFYDKFLDRDQVNEIGLSSLGTN